VLIERKGAERKFFDSVKHKVEKHIALSVLKYYKVNIELHYGFQPAVFMNVCDVEANGNFYFGLYWENRSLAN